MAKICSIHAHITEPNKMDATLGILLASSLVSTYSIDNLSRKSVSRGIKSNKEKDSIRIFNEKSQFFEVVNFWGITFSFETLISSMS